MKFFNKYEITPSLVFLLGSAFGFLSHLSLQDGLYNSQIVVNLMGYARDDVMYIWGVNLWTVMSQVSGALLLIGVTEFAQSIGLSVVLNGLSFCSLYLILNSISKNSLYSLALVLINYFSRHYLYGLGYEVSMSSWHFFNSTWGNYGFHFALLSLGLIFSNRLKTGYFLLGAMLSIHFFIGFYFVVSVGLALLLFKKNKEDLNVILKWFLFGILFSIISYMINFYQYGVVDLGASQSSLHNYIANWDTHRNVSINYIRSAVISNILLFLYVNYLFFIKKVERSISLCWIYSASSLCLFVIAFYLFSLMEVFPFLYTAMPERTFNVLYYLSIPILCSLQSKTRRVFPLVLFFGVVALDQFFQILSYDILSIILLLSLFIFSFFSSSKMKLHERKIAMIIILSLSIYSICNYNFLDRIKRIDKSFNNERNTFLKKSNGMLIVSPLHISSKVQLFTRRKILMDVTELSEISYAFHTYSKANDIMKNIYNIELNNNYKSLFVIHNGVETVAPEYVRKIWEDRSKEVWKEIFKQYQVSQVLVPENWNLKIKPVYTDSIDKVYEVE